MGDALTNDDDRAGVLHEIERGVAADNTTGSVDSTLGIVPRDAGAASAAAEKEDTAARIAYREGWCLTLHTYIHTCARASQKANKTQ